MDSLNTVVERIHLVVILNEYLRAYKGVLPKYVEVSNISPSKETSNALKSPVVNNSISIGESLDHDGQT